MADDAGIAALCNSLKRHGLIPRGGFAFGDDEERPAGPSGRPAVSILLVGHGGGAIWPHFEAWRERQPALAANPLNSWSRAVIGAVAADFGAATAFPFEKPYWPFQQWAKRAEGLAPSPLGMLMHPQFGLWHAYRGALLFDRQIELAPGEKPAHPCDACAARPCLAACPVGAFSVSGHDVAACRSHLDSGAAPDCVRLGCRARDACPVGTDHRYGAAQIRFHMAAFAGRD